MDPFTAIVIAAITAASGLISGLIVAYAKPMAEDRSARSKEQRDQRREHLNRMHDMSLDRRPGARAAMPITAAAIGDKALSLAVTDYLDGTTKEEQELAIWDAKQPRGTHALDLPPPSGCPDAPDDQSGL